MYPQIICTTNRITYGGNITSKKFVFVFILMWIFAFTHFLSNNFDFISNNHKQFYFLKMYPTMLSEYFFVSNSINKFA